MRINAETHVITESTLRSLHRITASAGNAQSSIVTSASLAESLTDQFIDLLIEETNVGTSRFGRRLLSKGADSFHQSWDERNGWLSSGFGIEMAGAREGQRLKTVIAVRNAIIHGDGHFTTRQIKTVSSAIALRKGVREVLDSEVHGRRIILSPSSGRMAIGVAREYVLALDLAVTRNQVGNIGSR
ncbi:hypothetical protein [Arthrobacter gengyunqii]|uniref:Uncharacterized protein n=1 Tax=Arthrobacter gengyunqii TaxID=2886940 RepID=A0ABS8GNZ6_9MICC|nr:hypothetical protein [Arthrobacter gengyunqii]MCC3267581.1 hypothetical protein [Arthrobacter gengyunqii]